VRIQESSALGSSSALPCLPAGSTIRLGAGRRAVAVWR